LGASGKDSNHISTGRACSSVQYDSEVFSNVQQIGKLLEALKRFKHGSCSVLHGNPYLHVSMLDNYDYSAAEVKLEAGHPFDDDHRTAAIGTAQRDGDVGMSCTVT